MERSAIRDRFSTMRESRITPTGALTCDPLARSGLRVVRTTSNYTIPTTTWPRTGAPGRAAVGAGLCPLDAPLVADFSHSLARSALVRRPSKADAHFDTPRARPMIAIGPDGSGVAGTASAPGFRNSIRAARLWALARV